MGAGVKKLSFNNDYEVFFEEDNPQVLALNGLQNKYNDAVHIFIGLEVGTLPPNFDQPALKGH